MLTCYMTVRRIFESKRDEDIEWRKNHNDELRNLNCSPNIVRLVKFARLF